MDKSKRTNLSVNERNIIELTLQGESQRAISRLREYGIPEEEIEQQTFKYG